MGAAAGIPEAKMWILRWFGLVLMALAWVAGSGIYYMRYSAVDAPRPIYAPEGGLTSDRLDHGSPKVLILVSVLIFLVGLVAFLVGRFGQNPKAARQANRLELGTDGPDNTQDTASAARALFAQYRRQKRK
jgi:hypothetical protein